MAVNTTGILRYSAGNPMHGRSFKAIFYCFYWGADIDGLGKPLPSLEIVSNPFRSKSFMKPKRTVKKAQTPLCVRVWDCRFGSSGVRDDHVPAGEVS